MGRGLRGREWYQRERERGNKNITRNQERKKCKRWRKNEEKSKSLTEIEKRNKNEIGIKYASRSKWKVNIIAKWKNRFKQNSTDPGWDLWQTDWPYFYKICFVEMFISI